MSSRVIQQDTRQQMQRKHHKDKVKYFEEQGYTVINSKTLVGDYCIPSKGAVAVDTKKDCQELYADLIQDHERFRNECVLAQQCKIQLYILVESKEGFTCKEDITKWKNPRYFLYLRQRNKGLDVRPPASNVQLLKIMHSMERDYGVRFLFVPYKEVGAKIIELLEDY